MITSYKIIGTAIFGNQIIVVWLLFKYLLKQTKWPNRQLAIIWTNYDPVFTDIFMHNSPLMS